MVPYRSSLILIVGITGLGWIINMPVIKAQTQNQPGSLQTTIAQPIREHAPDQGLHPESKPAALTVQVPVSPQPRQPPIGQPDQQRSQPSNPLLPLPSRSAQIQSTQRLPQLPSASLPFLNQPSSKQPLPVTQAQAQPPASNKQSIPLLQPAPTQSPMRYSPLPATSAAAPSPNAQPKLLNQPSSPPPQQRSQPLTTTQSRSQPLNPPAPSLQTPVQSPVPNAQLQSAKPQPRSAQPTSNNSSPSQSEPAQSQSPRPHSAPAGDQGQLSLRSKRVWLGGLCTVAVMAAVGLGWQRWRSKATHAAQSGTTPASPSSFPNPIAHPGDPLQNGFRPHFLQENGQGHPPQALAVSPIAASEDPEDDLTTGDLSTLPSPVDSAPTTRIPKPTILEELVRDLHNGDRNKRSRAIWELGQRGDSQAVQPLVDLLIDSDSKQRSLILAALSEIGIQALKPLNRALTIGLQDDNPEVRKNAIRDLTRVYDMVTQVSQLLRHATQDPDPDVQETARWALNQVARIRTATGLEGTASQQKLSGRTDQSTS